jgi:hypothetical protein
LNSEKIKCWDWHHFCIHQLMKTILIFGINLLLYFTSIAAAADKNDVIYVESDGVEQLLSSKNSHEFSFATIDSMSHRNPRIRLKVDGYFNDVWIYQPVCDWNGYHSKLIYELKEALDLGLINKVINSLDSSSESGYSNILEMTYVLNNGMTLPPGDDDSFDPAITIYKSDIDQLSKMAREVNSYSLQNSEIDYTKSKSFLENAHSSQQTRTMILGVLVEHQKMLNHIKAKNTKVEEKENAPVVNLKEVKP